MAFLGPSKSVFEQSMVELTSPLCSPRTMRSPTRHHNYSKAGSSPTAIIIQMTVIFDSGPAWSTSKTVC